MTVTQLREGDYRPDGAGGFALATGGAGVLERVLFLLTARRGGFPLRRRWAADCICCLGRGPRPGEHWGPAMPQEALAGEENCGYWARFGRRKPGR